MRFTDPLALLFFALGLVFGSFGGVLIDRLPRGSAIWGRSKCEKCNFVIQAFDLVPVVSYITLGGRCRNCSERISARYPLVELVSGALFVLAHAFMPVSVPTALLLSVIFWLLLVISMIDMKTHSIPDALNIPFVLLSAVYAALTDPVPISAPLVLAGFFFVQWKVSGGKWVGSGDIILAAGLGFLLGEWEFAVLMLAVSYAIGAVAAGTLILTREKTLIGYLALGPFLSAGTLLVLVFGERILDMLM